VTKKPPLDLTPEQLLRIEQFKEKHGREWRSTLQLMWSTGTDVRQPDGHLLRQIRNRYADRIGEL